VAKKLKAFSATLQANDSHSQRDVKWYGILRLVSRLCGCAHPPLGDDAARFLLRCYAVTCKQSAQEDVRTMQLPPVGSISESTAKVQLEGARKQHLGWQISENVRVLLNRHMMIGGRHAQADEGQTHSRQIPIFDFMHVLALLWDENGGEASGGGGADGGGARRDSARAPLLPPPGAQQAKDEEESSGSEGGGNNGGSGEGGSGAR
jgi:hypothetical protein